MNGHTSHPDVLGKIARLIEERGWSRKEFARRAGLSPQTVQQIFRACRRPRNRTLHACARALELTVTELVDLPLKRILGRPGDLHRLYEEAMQPGLHAWLESHPEQARKLSEAELEELLSLQGTGGPLTSQGVEHFIERIERKRRLIEQIQVVAGTEYLELLEQFVELLYEKVQPYNPR